MPLTIISRNATVYREAGTGEMMVLWVPGRDVKVVKDLAGLNSVETTMRENAASAASKNVQVRKQASLSRVYVGKRYIYGSLPNEISDLRQSVKVWLTDDFVPANCQAFFFIFSDTVVIHGVQEQDDEGAQTWRTAQIALAEGDPVKSMVDAISDYALANSVEGLTVAVLNKLDLYEKLQKGLAIYGVSPVPFSKLKPKANLKPLYRHADYTILYLTLGLFGVIALLVSAGYLLKTNSELHGLESEVQEIQQRINAIKPNENLGTVSDPQTMLQMITRSINQQPSAIVHAAGEMASQLGELQSMKILLGDTQSGEVQISGATQGQVIAGAIISKMNENMLLGQEETAAQRVEDRPWVRKIMRTGNNGTSGNLAMILQIDQPAGQSPATPVAPMPTAEEGAAVPVSATVPEVPAAPTVSATQTEPQVQEAQ